MKLKAALKREYKKRNNNNNFKTGDGIDNDNYFIKTTTTTTTMNKKTSRTQASTMPPPNRRQQYQQQQQQHSRPRRSTKHSISLLPDSPVVPFGNNNSISRQLDGRHNKKSSYYAWRPSDNTAVHYSDSISSQARSTRRTQPPLSSSFSSSPFIKDLNELLHNKPNYRNNDIKGDRRNGSKRYDRRSDGSGGGRIQSMGP